MLNRICYLGDDYFSGPAIYLAGIMSHFGLRYDHVPSPAPPPDSFESLQYGLYVLSDYPSARFRPAQLNHLAECVHRGSGLVMFGGWESYHGRIGEYHRTRLVEVLPVIMAEGDDRRNYAQPCLVQKRTDHPILAGLPWETPPGIGGLNAVTPKPGTTTLLEAVPFHVLHRGGEYQFTPGQPMPLLVLGQYGLGRAAALTTDVAPHWVGGFVDWGDRRLIQDVEGGFIDVGNWYAQFFRNLLVWAGQLDKTPSTLHS